MIKFNLLVSLLLIFTSVGMAGGIRTVKVNDKKMQTIFLKMGKASVLRFSEKPKEVVIGNKNYYSVEFIGNDLTIQPLGSVETNLFVYTPYHTYGFILKVCSACRYDDLVYVKWKSSYRSKSKVKKVSPRLGYKAIGLSFDIGEDIGITVVKASVNTARSLRIIDVTIKNKSLKRKNIASFRFVATRGNMPLKGQGYVVEKDTLKNKEVSKARIFLPIKEIKGFTLNAWLDDQKSKIIIKEKWLN